MTMLYSTINAMDTKLKCALADLQNVVGRCWVFKVSDSSGLSFDYLLIVILSFKLIHMIIIAHISALSLDTKVDILHMVEDEIVEKFVKDENVMIFQTHLPPGIDLVRSEDGDHLVATRRFGVGETLFNNRAELISKDDLVDKKFVIKVDGTYILLDSQNHFVHRDGYAEMLGKTAVCKTSPLSSYLLLTCFFSYRL